MKSPKFPKILSKFANIQTDRVGHTGMTWEEQSETETETYLDTKMNFLQRFN